MFHNEVEVDETYMDVKESKNAPEEKSHAGRGSVGKTAVVGIKDRETKQVRVVQHECGLN